MSVLMLVLQPDFQRVAVIIIAAMCFVVGAGPERLTGGTLLAMLIVDEVYHHFTGEHASLLQLDTWHFALDSLACVAFMAIALFANRMYPLWIGALQLMAVFGHLAREMSDAMSSLTYAIITIAPSYFQIALLVGGLWFHRRRLKKYGTYSSWLHSSNLSPASVQSR